VTIDYSGVLDRIHRSLLPENYLEVGVQHGYTLRLALPCTKVIGVDPAPVLLAALGSNVQVHRMTSDVFFDDGHADRALDSKPIDLAFIDGLHLFEFALRDFCNIERRSHSDTVVILDDCLPRTSAEASRERSTVAWAGDVWRVLECLMEQRPDLDITVIRAAPTGLALIRNLDPTSRSLDPHNQSLMDRYLERDFDTFAPTTLPQLSVIDPDWSLIEPLLPAARRPGLDVDALVAARDRRAPDRRTRARRARYGVLHTRLGAHLANVVRSIRTRAM
jgi:predicted O-methyltransferase YrrM